MVGYMKKTTQFSDSNVPFHFNERYFMKFSASLDNLIQDDLNKNKKVNLKQLTQLLHKSINNESLHYINVEQLVL